MRTLSFALAAIMMILLAGCGEQQAPVPAAVAQAKKVAVQVPQPEAGAPATEAPEETVLPYAYDPLGRRDPFTPLLAIRKPVMGETDAPLTPLQTFDLGQLRLIAVIIGKGAPRAMVMAPDGKGYILQKGIKVGKNNGSVSAIRSDAVVVLERYYDLSGEVRENSIEIQLPKREGV